MAEAKPFAPYLWHRRKTIYYIVYPGPAPDFKKLNSSTGFRDLKKAKQALALYVERRARRERVEGAAAEGPLTVRRLTDKWLDNRQRKGISTVDDYRGRMAHALPIIGDLRADAVELEHIEQVMAAIKPDQNKPTDDDLAPRTQRRVYEALNAMFNWAVPRLLERNPCALKADELPDNVDADPEWRALAIFERQEVVAILSDERIPVDRRVFYAVMFLAGCRFGEISALKWRHYQRQVTPLRRLHVAFSYNSRKKRIKETKTKRTRLVPVHPVLATVLDWWHEVGWVEFMGRHPTDDDVLVPTRKGGHRSKSTMWRQLNGRRPKNGGRKEIGDLERIGLRRRRVHDTRRTFITLARHDGAQKDLLRLATHGPEGDMLDVYTESLVLWGPVCAEVAKLRIDLDLSKFAKSGDQGESKVAMEVAMPEIVSGIGAFAGDPTGNRSRAGSRDNEGQTTTARAKRRDPAAIAPREHGASADNSSHPRSMATMATLALRQALAALDRGRVDQARQILERAIEEESADAGEAAS